MYKENLKKIRKTLKLSMKELSEKINIPEPSLWSYEGGKRTPSLELPIQLYKNLNVNLNWFVSGEGPMFNTPIKTETPEYFKEKVEAILKEKGLI